MIEVTEKVDTSERKMTMEDILNIVELAVRVNGLEERNSDRNPDNKYPAAFANFSGHVAWVEVRIFENGWTREGIATEIFTFNTDGILDTELYEYYKRYMEELIDLVEKESSEGATSKDSSK